jgi:hypothetical protein
MKIYKNDLGKTVIENEELSIKSDNGFYIGDPCYALSDEMYRDVWGLENNFKNGIIETEKGSFIAQSTIYGDGRYSSSVGNLEVESGTIAVIPLNLVDMEKVAKYGDDFKNFAATIPGTEARLTFQTLDFSDEPYFSIKGDFIIDIKNPDKVIKIGIGHDYENDTNIAL